MGLPPHRPIPPLSERDLARFWKFVDKTPGHGPEGTCWLWTSGHDTKGYGTFGIGLVTSYRAPRVVWRIAHGEDPKLLHVLHRCDNPPCVNPKHLFTGTVQDNCRDAFRKGRRSMAHMPPRPFHAEKDALVVHLRDVEGLTFPQIAAIMKVASSTVSARYRKSKQGLGSRKATNRIRLGEGSDGE